MAAPSASRRRPSLAVGDGRGATLLDAAVRAHNAARPSLGVPTIPPLLFNSNAPGRAEPCVIASVGHPRRPPRLRRRCGGARARGRGGVADQSEAKSISDEAAVDFVGADGGRRRCAGPKRCAARVGTASASSSSSSSPAPPRSRHLTRAAPAAPALSGDGGAHPSRATTGSLSGPMSGRARSSALCTRRAALAARSGGVPLPLRVGRFNGGATLDAAY